MDALVSTDHFFSMLDNSRLREFYTELMRRLVERVTEEKAKQDRLCKFFQHFGFALVNRKVDFRRNAGHDRTSAEAAKEGARHGSGGPYPERKSTLSKPSLQGK